MKNNLFCPISETRINEKVARLNAFITVFILLLFGLTSQVFLIVFLAIDFFLRAIDYSKYSPIAILSKFLIDRFSNSPVWINAGPKIFAARIGLTFGALILLSVLFNLNGFAIGLVAILAIFSLLESVFGICVACKIYPYVYRLVYK